MLNKYSDSDSTLILIWHVSYSLNDSDAGYNCEEADI